MRLCEKGWAVAAFIRLRIQVYFLSAYETEPDAPTLPFILLYRCRLAQ